MNVLSLHIYPIKSCRGHAVKELNVLRDGPEGDRQWMLVDEQGKFLSQRTHPKMATIETFLDDQGLTVGFQKQFFRISRSSSSSRVLPITIWNESFDAALEPDLYSQAISQYLGVSCRLVRYTSFSKRIVGAPGDGEWQTEVRFADGRPLLLTNSQSLEDLNSKLLNPVGMERFRPNVVFRGTKAFEEESWKRIRIGEVTFSQPKTCARCVMINIDQEKGVSMGAEPLKTLASYRRDGTKVNFGSLWIPENAGKVKSSDQVEVLD